MDLLSLLTSLLGGFNVPGIEDEALAWLKETGQTYPDVRTRIDALASWLSTTITEAKPELEPAKMRDTLWGIASDLVHNTSGVDPKAWAGMG